MKNWMIQSIGCLIILVAIATTSPLAGAPAMTQKTQVQKVVTLEDFSQISIKELEQKYNQAFSFKEKMTLRLLQRQTKRLLKKKPTYAKQSVDQLFSTACGRIVLQTGEIIDATILEIGLETVKYRRCDKPNDPEIILAKTEVFSVVAADGKVLFIQDLKVSQEPSLPFKERKMDQIAIGSFSLSLLGVLLLASVPALGYLSLLVGLVLGIVSLVRIRRNKGKMKGSALAILSLLMAGIGILLGITVIAQPFWLLF